MKKLVAIILLALAAGIFAYLVTGCGRAIRSQPIIVTSTTTTTNSTTTTTGVQPGTTTTTTSYPPYTGTTTTSFTTTTIIYTVSGSVEIGVCTYEYLDVVLTKDWADTSEIRAITYGSFESGVFYYVLTTNEPGTYQINASAPPDVWPVYAGAYGMKTSLNLADMKTITFQSWIPSSWVQSVESFPLFVWPLPPP